MKNPSRRQAMQVAAAGAMSAAQGAPLGALGSRLRGLQHFGVTVQNMNRAFEFYTEVLGGTEVMRDGDFQGSPIHNTLLLNEELRARQQRIHPHTMGIPDLRHGTQRLDVRFVQFDNMVIELLQYRDREQPSGSGNSFAPPHEQTSPAYPGSSHLCFYLKDDTDFDQFVRDLEAECARRGMTNVKANRTREAATEADRQKLPMEANSIKIREGKSNGWSLIYCKGPEGEQLEFVQVRGPVKQTFDGAFDKRQKLVHSKA